MGIVPDCIPLAINEKFRWKPNAGTQLYIVLFTFEINMIRRMILWVYLQAADQEQLTALELEFRILFCRFQEGATPTPPRVQVADL